ncbi:PTS sugar transporter subunit IIA [Lysinibacillus sphaericus]|uniref:PTS sugar transporter subunit IIA n=1 Tax=Lysinibacillus sphaericus TaxID=1421 RepID=UPI0004DF8EBB|nr:PTS sugar transporter subunit IIA [Lysinibacillus sphaericus]QPA59997.1 PTS sugar transporter subunit IIA [Lysinibacillus sphaericus]
MLTKLLTKDCIQIANVVPSWQEAIRLAATPLVRQNKIEQRYIEAMIQSIEQYGPYVVITPKVALPHARPSDDVYALAVSLLCLQQPVFFSPNQPVFLIFVLAAMDNTSHLQALADLTLVLQHPDQVDSLIACQHEEDISEKIKQFTTKESAG